MRRDLLAAAARREPAAAMPDRAVATPTPDRVVAAIALALATVGVDADPAIGDPFASMVDLLPGWVVDAAYEAVARGLHAAAAAVAALMLATALAMAAILRRRSPARVVADRDVRPATASRGRFPVCRVTHSAVK